MSRNRRYLCGVPPGDCTGSKLSTDQSLETDKCHASPSQAYKCMAHYLVKVKGYKRLPSHTFAPSDGGYARILTKPSRYGGVLVAGKEGRFMPEKRNQGNRGVIF